MKRLSTYVHEPIHRFYLSLANFVFESPLVSFFSPHYPEIPEMLRFKNLRPVVHLLPNFKISRGYKKSGPYDFLLKPYGPKNLYNGSSAISEGS